VKTVRSNAWHRWMWQAASDITFLSNPKYRKQLDDVLPVP
jgi:hypothetical protein